jgi:hypothetical protein
MPIQVFGKLQKVYSENLEYYKHLRASFVDLGREPFRVHFSSAIKVPPFDRLTA